MGLHRFTNRNATINIRPAQHQDKVRPNFRICMHSAGVVVAGGCRSSNIAVCVNHDSQSGRFLSGSSCSDKEDEPAYALTCTLVAMGTAPLKDMGLWLDTDGDIETEDDRQAEHQTMNPSQHVSSCMIAVAALSVSRSMHNFSKLGWHGGGHQVGLCWFTSLFAWKISPALIPRR